MAPTTVHVVFDLEKKEATISGSLKGFLIEKDSFPLTISESRDSGNAFTYFEVYLEPLDNVPEGSKWEFSWKQWNYRDQTLKLEQFIPFQMSENIFYPSTYDPRTTLAASSYNAKPSKGTTQTSRIRQFVNHNFSKEYNLIMEVKGRPSIADWKTKPDLLTLQNN